MSRNVGVSVRVGWIGLAIFGTIAAFAIILAVYLLLWVLLAVSVALVFRWVWWEIQRFRSRHPRQISHDPRHLRPHRGSDGGIAKFPVDYSIEPTNPE